MPVVADKERAVIAEIMNEIEKELITAISLFSPDNSPHEGYAVIKEEVDELWDLVKGNEGWKPQAMKEAVQIAAMAARYIYDLRERP